MTTDTKISVEIGAQTDGLKTGMNDASQAVQRAATTMRESMTAAFASMKNAMTGHLDSIKTSTVSMSSAFKDMADKVNAAGGGVGGALKGMHEMALALPGPLKAAAVAVGALLVAWQVAGAFKEAVTETSKFTGEANKLAKTMGITATEASTLSIALGDVYTDTETFSGASAMLGRQLRKNEDALKAMGLQTRDTQGEYRNLKDLMMDSITVINGYKEGTDRNLAAMTMWGRGATDAAGLLRLNNEVIEEAKRKQQELGLVVGQENVEANKKYKAAMNDVGDVMLAMKKVIGDAFMPILTRVGEWFSVIAPPAVFALKVAFNAFSSVVLALMGAFEALWSVLAGVISPILAVGRAMRKAIQGDFQGATEEMKNMWTNWGSNIADGFKKAGDVGKRTWKEISDQWGKPTATKLTDQSGKKGYVDPKEKDSKDKSRMPEFEAELAKRRDAFERASLEEGNLREYSKKEESAYWKTISEMAGISAEDKSKAASKFYAAEKTVRGEAFAAELASLKVQQEQYKNDAQMQVLITEEAYDKIAKMHGADSKQAIEANAKVLESRKKLSDEIVKLAELAKDATRNTALFEIDSAEQTAQFLAAQKMISQAELLALEKQFEDARFELKAGAAKAAADLEPDPAKRAEMLNKLLELEQQHAEKLKTIKQKMATQDVFVEGAKTWIDSMEGAFTNAIAGMMNKTMSFRQALGSLWKSMYANFATEMVAKPLAAVAMRAIRESAIYKMIAGEQITAQGLASGVVVATKATEATAVVASNAAEAASGAAASQASIPIVGPGLAALAMAAMLAMVMGLGGKGGSKSSTTSTRLPSASKGFDIPAGINPLTQLHEKEMVLPAEQADAVRSMAGGGAGGSVSVSINAHPMPGNYFMVHKKQLVEAIKAARRDNSFA